MSRILLTWELGAGLGHVARLCGLAMQLAQRGHTIVLAGRDVDRCRTHFAIDGIDFVQAPIEATASRQVSNPNSLADVLFNCGFSEFGRLRRSVLNWRELIEQVRPNIIVADASPTVLLSSSCRIR